jgi:rsbT co-antagonist protein RsbR
MSKSDLHAVADLVETHEKDIMSEWLELQKKTGMLQSGRIKEPELQAQSRNFLKALREALGKGGVNTTHVAYGPVRDMLGDLSSSRAVQGFSPVETATFVFSLKQPLFNALTRAKLDAATLAQTSWAVTVLLDELGLHTMERYQKSREEVILRQQREIAELSTPVVKLWDGILALPLIGTLDSQRTQVVMENLLQTIVDEEAEIAIIDITGVPTVDTLTAQYLLKAIAAARLMGADCIISGIRPQIAQTMVHLGVELNVVSKATLADALKLALHRINRTVVAIKAAPAKPAAARPGGTE